MAQSSSDPNPINQVPIGIGADSVALLFGGSPRLLLVRESLITAVFGLACFFSLLLPRPMMFYFARNFIAGTDPARQARFNTAWQFPEVRFCPRLITTSGDARLWANWRRELFLSITCLRRWCWLSRPFRSGC